jgi:hypothetical protein
MQINNMKLKITLAALAVFAFCSCKKAKTEEITGNTNPAGTLTEAGYGSSQMPFTAASWQLPATVQLADSIHDYSYCWAFPPNTQVLPKDWKGVPLGFTFCLTLRNKDNNNPIIVQFPPQVIFTSSSVLHQNVLTINLGTVQLLPGEEKTIVAQGFCINKGRKIPQTFDEATGNFLSYSFGPSVIPPALQEIADILQSKNRTMNDILKADGTIDNTKAAKYAVIQKAIWEVTDGQGLTADTKNELLAL